MPKGYFWGSAGRPRKYPFKFQVILLFRLFAIFQNDVVIAAFYNTGRRNQRDFSVFLQLFNGQATAVTHGMFHFAQGQIDIVFQAAGIGDVGVDTFLKGELFVAA